MVLKLLISIRLERLLLVDCCLRSFSLSAALAFTSDVGNRCSSIFLLSCCVALLSSKGLVLVDGLRLENTLCDIHGLNMFDVEDIQIL